MGIDLGTSGVRGVAIDDDKEELASVSVALDPPQRSRGGKSEQDPMCWWRSVMAVLQKLTAALASYSIRALAVDGTSGTVVLCDPEGHPLAPALMYDDSRSYPYLSLLHRIAPADSPVHSASSSLAKWLYLLDYAPAAEARLLHQADWVLGRLTGRYGISDENNCLKLGYDARRRAWPKWLEKLNLPPLPRVYPPGTLVSAVSKKAAEQTGLPKDCWIATGTTDSTAAALATGISRAGEAVTTLGSTLVVKVLAEKPLCVPQYGLYSHRMGDRWLAGGASNSGGAVLAHYFSAMEMEWLSARIDPDRPTGLDYYPLLEPGERFPVNDSGYPPRLSPRPKDSALFFQAILEGIARIERQGYRLLNELGAPFPASVTTSGGGAKNEVWRRIRQRLLGVPVMAARHQQAAYGSALLARAAARSKRPLHSC